MQQLPQQSRQNQPIPMEVDQPQQPQSYDGQETQNNSGQGHDVMVVDPSPPETPKQGDQQQHQPQQMYIQTSGGQVVRHIPQSGQQGTQIIRQVTTSNPRQTMHVMQPQQVHIIQQQPGQVVTVPQSGQGERVTVFVRQSGQQTRPIQGQIRQGQQIVNAPQQTYIYQQAAPSGSGPVTTKYIVNTTPTQNRTASGSGETDNTDSHYYSPPPQLTPQQILPQRGHRPPGTQGYAHHRPRQVGHTQRMVTAQGGQKQQVRYIPVQSQGQTYVAAGTSPSGSVQFIRSSGQPVRYMTTGGGVVRMQSQNIRGQHVQSVQQYPTTVQGQQITTRVPIRASAPRVKVQVPTQAGQPRRVRPANIIQHVPQSTVNVVQVSQPLRTQTSTDAPASQPQQSAPPSSQQEAQETSQPNQ